MYSSTYILVITAFDRYRAICYPMFNYAWTSRRIHTLVAGAWLLSMVLALPQIFIFSLQEIRPGSGIQDCWATFRVSRKLPDDVIRLAVLKVSSVLVAVYPEYLFTHTKIGPVHRPTPAFVADDFTLTSIRRSGGSIRRVSAGDNTITSQHPRSH